jgi:hypothetical protein
MPYVIDTIKTGSIDVTQSITINGQPISTGSSQTYKVYSALLTQSGTSAPTAIVLENTFEGEIVWTRGFISGIYTATLVGAFTLGKTIIKTNNQIKTFVIIEGSGKINQTSTITPFIGDENEIYLYTDVDGDTADNVLDGVNTWVEIKVYP